MKKALQTIITGFTALVILTVFQTAPTHAATLSVATGNDENTDNSSCSLSEAIENINNQAQTNTDCTAGDGVNDTINIPAGTITLVADLPTLSESATITGAGMGQSVIDGDGQYQAIQMAATENETLSVSDLTVTGFKGIGVSATGANLNIERVETDGANSVEAGSIALAGFGAQNIGAGTNTTVSIDNSYVHDISDAGVSLGIYGIFIYTSNGATLDLSVSNVTLSDIENTAAVTSAGGILAMGGMLSGGDDSTFSANLENITINNVRAVSTAFGVGVANYTGTNDSSSIIRIRNSTIIDINGGNNPNAPTQGSRGIFVGGGGASGVATVSLSIENVLLGNITTAGVPAACGKLYDYTPGFGGSGSFNGSITSTGGNLSSDTTCSPYFTHPKDQNNLTNLSSTLGPLQNNGGTVPTRALLQGSPAIDAGVTVAGLTQDARGSVRPQGLAYDSGAYESPFTQPVAATPATTLANTGQSRMTLAIVTMFLLAASIGTALYLKRRQM